MTRLQLGKKGEREACRFLEKLHYVIIAKNFKCSYGEIDIIAIDKEELVFIEVKTRCSEKYGRPSEAVDKTKKKHIKKAATFFVYKNRLENKFIRFDVVEIYVRNGKFYIKHIKNTLW